MSRINLRHYAKLAIGAGLIFNGTKSVIDNLFRPTVYPKFGSVVYCDLAFSVAEHSGIYVGNGEIVHLNRFGNIEKVSFAEFIENTPAITIYVSSNKGKAVGSEKVGNFALNLVGQARPYNVLTRNCHQFTSGCLTEEIDNSDLLLRRLKQTAQHILGANQWLALAPSQG